MWFESRDYVLETKHLTRNVTLRRMSNITEFMPYPYTSKGENCLLVTGAQFSSLKMLGLIAVLKTKHEAHVIHEVSFPSGKTYF